MKEDPHSEIATAMIRVLEARRADQPHAPPLTLRQLAQRIPSASPDQVLKGAGSKRFTSRVVVTQPKNLDAPVALVEDLDSLADSHLLLEFVLESVCTPAKPLWSVSGLKAKVTPRLRQLFADAIERQIQQQRLPVEVGVLLVRKAPKLYLKRIPLPKPPEIELAENLVRVLEVHRRMAGVSLVSLERLLQLTDMQASRTLVRKALAAEPFRTRVVLALPKDQQTPVALMDELKGLAENQALLELILARCRTPSTHATTASDWKKKINPALWPLFTEAVNRWIASAELPATVGCILIRNKRHLFLLTDLQKGHRARDRTFREAMDAQATPAPPTAIMAAPLDFAPAFEEAFDRLDRQKGGHNFVHLIDLRRALPLNRPAFDRGLAELRLARRFTLSAAEGRHGISPDEKEAGIAEDGALLLYVSRIETP
jgi:hypothetical protein